VTKTILALSLILTSLGSPISQLQAMAAADPGDSTSTAATPAPKDNASQAAPSGASQSAPPGASQSAPPGASPLAAPSASLFAAPSASQSNTPIVTPALLAGGSQAAAQALELVLAGHEIKAHDLLLEAYKQGNKSKTLSPDIPYFLAAFEKKGEQPGAAVSYLLEARELYGAKKSLTDRQTMLLTKRIADCYYSADNLKNSLREYNVALLAARGLPDCILPTTEILEGIVACEIGLKQFDAAEKHSKALVQLCHARLESGGVYELLGYSWALLQEADVFRLSEQKEKLDAVRKEMRPLLTMFVESRMLAEVQGQLPDYQTQVQSARTEYITNLKPVSPAEIAWAACDFRVRTLPIIAWKQSTPTPLAAILCIHGMGLENRAFTAMAADLNRRGYIVYALDVRGFGSWTQTRGEENLDYNQALADIHNVSLIIKDRNPGVPLYVLGESMGGAIALRAGAQLGDVLNGVIASVPSAERFQAKKMSLQTAMHFMIDPHRAFDIGANVAAQATSQEALRAKWRADPKAKLAMTPVELIKFALFMRMTKPQAAKITQLPVLMLQGLQDQLVKPQGTFDLFDAVRSTDKTFLTIGKAEHLMFENEGPDPILMDALDSWLKHHTIKDEDKAARSDDKLKP
jgi:lysophospholipase